MSEVTGRLTQSKFSGRWMLDWFHPAHDMVRYFRRRIDAVAFAARKGIRLEET